MKGKMMGKIAATAGVLLVLAAALLVLFHPAQNSVQTVSRLPEIDDRAVYVECKAGEPVEAQLHTTEDFTISGFSVLMVNLSGESAGNLQVSLTDGSGNLMLEQSVPVNTITPGEWFEIPGNAVFEAGRDYLLSFETDESDPYFMQVPRGGDVALPFEQEVQKGGELQDCGISLGVNTVTQSVVTYGDIFYYSVPICILTALFLLLGIWSGLGRIRSFLAGIPVGEWIRRYGSDLFLFLIFGLVCISIYCRAYQEGVYISADSAGYLREAVCLAKGQGFSYDGLAGYQTWFANWPVLYPVMIAAAMVLTGTGAYLASKLVAMAVAALLLLALRLCFKKDAWIYALCLTNIGFLNLAYYTWSEIPFILFLFCFGAALAGILRRETPQKRWYVLLGLSGLGCFLTRYFGIYVWMVAGLYILGLLYLYRREKNRRDLKKALGLIVTAGVSGMLSVAYLFMNRQMNGMASGVSRTMWWDDYQSLTNDLIESLLTEIFNVFSLQIPEFIEKFSYSLKVWVVLLALAGILLLIVRACRKLSLRRIFMEKYAMEAVMLLMAAVYYGVFIVIRYFSSMDTFYFRFFEPATFLLCIGLIGLILPQVKGKYVFRCFAGGVTVLTALAVLAAVPENGWKAEKSYYAILTGQWAESYSEIPEKSVIIFNDIDYRSSWFRPDVVDGEIRPEDTLESIRETYYGSDYLCIKAEFAAEMTASGEYNRGVQSWLEEGLAALDEEQEYVVLSLAQVYNETGK